MFTKIPTRGSGSSLISSTADVGVTLEGPGPFPCSSMCIHGYSMDGSIPLPRSQPWQVPTRSPGTTRWQAREETLALSGVGTSRIVAADGLTSAVPGDAKELNKI